jgi:hypothetical protein
MIKGLMGGNGLNVNGGNTSVPYVNQNNTNPMQGMLRIWGSDMQVYDGNNWMNISSSYATVELNGESQSIMQWAREQRNRQIEREQLVKKNPALQKAWDNIERAEANFDILAKFVEHDDTGVAEQAGAWTVAQSSP